MSGITPACAGRRSGQCFQTARHTDHPRVCGEKLGRCRARRREAGSPPRVRGEAPNARTTRDDRRITPACAGRRRPACGGEHPCKDHPRVRGEKSGGVMQSSVVLGSPPRARGEVFKSSGRDVFFGITPACAGRSSTGKCRSSKTGDHPRVRGEKLPESTRRTACEGSPPRARGEGANIAPHTARKRITPACAGRSRPCRRTRLSAQDHPRVRGEKLPFFYVSMHSTGSPPRARGEGKA